MTAARLETNAREAFTLYVFVSGFLHLIWETLQLPLYTIWRTGTAYEISFAVVHCTAGDVVIAAVSVIAAVVLVRLSSSPSERGSLVVAATLVLGIGFTIYSEWVNTVLRKTWAYSELMPTVPVLGTGISPLLQWIVVPLLALSFVKRRLKNQ